MRLMIILLPWLFVNVFECVRGARIAKVEADISDADLLAEEREHISLAELEAYAFADDEDLESIAYWKDEANVPKPIEAAKCSWVAKMPDKSFHFDLPSKNLIDSIAIEIKRQRAGGLKMFVHRHKVWNMYQDLKLHHVRGLVPKGEVIFEAIKPPGAPDHKVEEYDLLSDATQITNFHYTDHKSKNGPLIGVGISLENHKNLTFIGGSYYSKEKVELTMKVLAHNASKNDKATLATAHDVQGLRIVVSPVMKGIKTALGVSALYAPLSLGAFGLFHEASLMWLVGGPVAIAGTAAVATGAGVWRYMKLAHKQREGKLTAAEKMFDIIWCMSTTEQKCGRHRLGPDGCFYTCPGIIGKKLVIPLAKAKSEDFKCPETRRVASGFLDLT